MRAGDGVTQLRADIKRWRERSPEAESTYCQGVANKAAKLFEALIKRLVEQRVAVTGCDLSSLLVGIRYKGDASTVDKLPLGSVTQLLMKLTEYDDALAEARPPEIPKALTTLVGLRNKTTHELAAGEMRVATASLLDLIEAVLGRDAFGALL